MGFISIITCELLILILILKMSVKHPTDLMRRDLKDNIFENDREKKSVPN